MPVVALRGREFTVADHGAEVFRWATENAWEKRTLDFLDRFLRPEDTFLDIGAWIGAISLYAVGKCKEVMAFEPDPIAFPILLSNTKNLGVSCWPYAIAGWNGSVTLGSGLLGASTTRMNLGAGHGIGEAAETFAVKCLPLSNVAGEKQVCIKIDVEGMEEGILGSSLEFLAERKPNMIVELHPEWWHYPAKMIQTLEALSRIYPHAWKHGQYLECHA